MILRNGPEANLTRSRTDQDITGPDLQTKQKLRRSRVSAGQTWTTMSPRPGPGETETRSWVRSCAELSNIRHQTIRIRPCCWCLVPCSAAPAEHQSLCSAGGQTVRHHISSRQVSFSSCSASCCQQEDLKIEPSIRERVRHRWDSNRRSGGLIIVIYQNQHFETSESCFQSWSGRTQTL